MSDQRQQTGSTDPRIDAAFRDYLERVDHGDVPDAETFLEQHAEIADALRSLISAELQLRKLASGTSTRAFTLQGQETIAPQAREKRAADTAEGALREAFGRYRILRVLGQGAMGTVYLAEDTQLQRQVALKTPQFGQSPEAELLERFYREARAAATLRHPNICPVYDVGQIDGTHYLSMAYIEGNALSAFIQPGKPRSERQVLIVVRKLAQALQEAHDHQIVHRDLKPANIMVDRRSEPIIMDFGLARQVRHEQETRITQSGMLLGTPAYMSPEQIDGEPDQVGPRSDQYSLGVILYELLTGQLPFRGSLTAVLGQILVKEVTPPSQLRTDLDTRIEAVCLKMLAKNPNDRFASLSAAAEEMAAILKNPEGKTTSKAKRAAGPGAGAGTGADNRASESAAMTSGVRRSMTGQDLNSLEELARKCLARRDYDQVIQIVERIPEGKRTAGLIAVLEGAREKADEISFLICEIDEAVRLHDRATALKKSGELLKIKPGHHRARDVQEKYSGYGAGGAARIGPLAQFTQPWNEGGWIPWSALLFGVAVAGVVSGVIVIQLGKTAVVIDVQDPGIRVAIADLGKKIQIITGPGESKVDVEPGEQELKISYAGLETRTTRFELKRGQKRRLTVSIANKELLAKLDQESLPLIDQSEKAGPGQSNGKPPQGQPVKVAVAPAKGPALKPTQPVITPAVPATSSAIEATADGFVPLFNGRDLTGWKTHPSQPGNWRVENGVLIGSGAESSHLYTERDDYADFHLRVEARIVQHGNSGVDFRTSFGPRWPEKAPKYPYGYEAQIDNDNHRDRTGSLFVMDGGKGSGTAVVRVRDSLVPPGAWFTMEVVAQGQHIEIKVNGGKVASRDDSHFAKGHIGLQQLESQTVVEFRKVEIKELARVAAPREDASPPQHFVQLFNGRDLSGWKTHPSQPGNWRVENGMLVGSGPGSPTHLYTERGDYKDFHLRVEARVNEKGNSGVYYRARFGPKFPAKRPSWLLAYNAKLDENRLGAFLLDDGSPQGPRMVRTRVPEPLAGRWVVLDVIVRGNHIVIKTDGVTTAEFTDEKRHYNSGYIALQQHTRETRVEFRKIEIEELDATTPDASTESSPLLTPTPGFVSLFNGRDLTGWETRPGESSDWHVDHGILTGGLPGGSSFLYSERGDYKDFDLRIEARIKDDADTAFWIRALKPADGESGIPKLGYKFEMREPEDAKQNRTGSIWAVGRKDGHVTLSGYGRHERFVRPGEWFTLEVIARGSHTVVLVNGKGPTNQRWNQRDTYRNGAHLALEQHRDHPPVEFRRIEIKEY